MNYPFNTGDLLCCAQCANNYLDNNTTVPWEDLRYIFGEIMYGGHIVEDWDRRLCSAYLARTFTAALLDAPPLFPGFQPPSGAQNHEQVGPDSNLKLGPEGSNLIEFSHWNPLALALSSCTLGSRILSTSQPWVLLRVIQESLFAIRLKWLLTFIQVMTYIEEEMPFETPLAFGLHPNAEIGFKLREGARFCSSIAALHPQSAAATGGLSTEEKVRIMTLFVVLMTRCL